MNRQQLTALPAVIDVPTAARALGLSRTTAYDLIRNDQWPTPVVRVGRLIRIPTAPILELLGIEPFPTPVAPSPRPVTGRVPMRPAAPLPAAARLPRGSHGS